MTPINNPLGTTPSPEKKYNNRVTIMIAIYWIMIAYAVLNIAATGDIRSLNLAISAAVLFPFYLLFIKWVLRLPMQIKSDKRYRTVRKIRWHSGDTDWGPSPFDPTGINSFLSPFVLSSGNGLHHSSSSFSGIASTMNDFATSLHSSFNDDYISFEASNTGFSDDFSSSFQDDGFSQSAFDDSFSYSSFDSGTGFSSIDDAF